MDERVQFYSKEILAKKEKLREVLPSVKEERHLENKLRVLENQLLKEKVQLNKDLVRNQQIRDEIDMYRRDKVAFTNIFKDMHTESKALESQATDTSKVLRKMEDDDERFRRQLVELKTRAQTAMDGYQSQAAERQDEIEKDRFQYRDASRSFSEKVYPDSHIYIDNNQILKVLYDKWVGLCKDQKKVVDQYNKTVRYLSDAFLEIKEATGIGSIHEMVTGLVKAQEQEQVLLGNLNAVMAQADLLENRLKDLEDHYQTLVRAQRTTLSKNDDHLSELRQELAGLRSLFQKKKEKQAKLKAEVESIQKPLSMLMGMFRDSNLGPQDLVMGEGRDVDVLQKVAHLEKSITFMVQYLSIGHNEGLPAVFESDLLPKDFSISGEATRAPKGTRFEDHDGLDEADRPLSALEIRQRVRQKFPNLQ